MSALNASTTPYPAIKQLIGYQVFVLTQFRFGLLYARDRISEHCVRCSSIAG
jgi:hypothetical protein